MTPARQRILDVVRRITADGWPASVEEIRLAAGHASRSTAWEHLRFLERDGFVIRHPRNQKGGYMPREAR